ncbi:MAG: hypothetical protein IJ874_00425 [Ruminococcus sp.]|nr:hypothetical protein [Ruminococcus sp.]
MDISLIIAASVLAVIALIEILCLFLPLKQVSPLYSAVLPVFSDDEQLSERLDCLALRSGGRSCLIIVNYSATDEQLRLCRQFCSSAPDCIIVTPEELEKIFLKTFAIQRNV